MNARAPARLLALPGATVELGERPWLMGIVNATPDSFSDSDEEAHPSARARRVLALAQAGADVIDVGGESGITGVAPVPAAEEIERVCELVARAASLAGVVVSVDTYKPEVARAAIAAGARIVNDVSGLADPELADVCAESGAALVLMHTSAPPKRRLQDPDLYGDVTAEVIAFLAGRIELALARGLSFEQLIVDPGPDFTKTPRQTVELLGRLEELHTLERPVLLAVSRKDFVGAITGRPPRDRLAGTLAALGDGVDRGAHLLRVHDVDAAADFLAVRAALRGEAEVASELTLPESLRHEPRGAA